eukprot:353294-Chlamydomonas_euryale.AAC.7
MQNAWYPTAPGRRARVDIQNSATIQNSVIVQNSSKQWSKQFKTVQRIARDHAHPRHSARPRPRPHASAALCPAALHCTSLRPCAPTPDPAQGLLQSTSLGEKLVGAEAAVFERDFSKSNAADF